MRISHRDEGTLQQASKFFNSLIVRVANGYRTPIELAEKDEPLCGC